MPMKVFELAKELEIGAIDLVEKMRADGIHVRNHMASIDDSVVTAVRASFAPAEDVKKAKPKKKVRKKASSKVKKKVIRRKVTDEEVIDTPATDDQVASVKEEEVASPVAASEETTKEVEEAPAKSGLRVVKRAPVIKRTKKTAEEKIEKEEKVEEKPKKVPLREKRHVFTPVYIPSQDKNRKVEQPEAKTKVSKPVKVASPADAEAVAAKGSGKKDTTKRLGGLASMISGGTNVVTKAEKLKLERAEAELKSYSALSLTGRPLFTNVRRKRVYSGPAASTEVTEVKDAKRVITLHDGAYALDFAKKLSVKFKELVDKSLSLNLLLKKEDYIGIKLAQKIASLYKYRVENKAFNEESVIEEVGEVIQDKNLVTRNPVITIMGHVDHGKTTLLDHIRDAKVASGEAGGITQHIGAYKVKVGDKELTFLDTPGHAAFAQMRQRGADATDIVVLVVAADDGVMPQTKESIKFCKNSKKPVIVAINKMDKEGVTPDRIKQELIEFDLTPEEWGGDTIFVPISALKGDGVDSLLESIAIQAEMMELKANPKGRAEGVVIESKIEKGRGPVATVLIQKGTLKKGDSVVCGEVFGRAKNMMGTLGENLNNVGPSTPVQILGFNESIIPGDIFNVVKNEREAKKIAVNRSNERKQLENVPTSSKKKLSLEDFFASALVEEETRSLNLVIRSDVQGSFEAIKSSLLALSSNEVQVKIIGGGVGAINDSDVKLAISADGFIIGFNMRPISTARRIAEDHGIDVKTYSVIYELINDVKLAIEGLLEPEFIEKFMGRAEVKDTFEVPRMGVIAGSLVTDGKIVKGGTARLLRNGKIVFEGKIASLKRFKDDAKEVSKGFECGVGFENFTDIKSGDIFEGFEMEERKRTYEDVVKDSGEDQKVL